MYKCCDDARSTGKKPLNDNATKTCYFSGSSSCPTIVLYLAIYIPPESVYSSQQRLESRDYPINLQCAYHFIIDALYYRDALLPNYCSLISLQKVFIAHSKGWQESCSRKDMQ